MSSSGHDDELGTYLKFSTSYIGGVRQDLDGFLEHGAEGIIRAVTAERGRVRAAYLLRRQVDYLEGHMERRINYLYSKVRKCATEYL